MCDSVNFALALGNSWCAVHGEHFASKPSAEAPCHARLSSAGNWDHWLLNQPVRVDTIEQHSHVLSAWQIVAYVASQKPSASGTDCVS